LYDKKAQSDIELQCQYYRTFRAYYIALHYFLIKKYVESSGLCIRVEKYVKEMQTLLKNASQSSELGAQKLGEFESEIKQLVEDVAECKRKLQTNIMTAKISMGVERSDTAKLSLSERLDVYFNEQKSSANAAKAKDKKEVQLEPSKPLFFDLALNYVDLPSYDDKIDAKKPQQQQAGVKGFIKGFFGF
jgi:signal recognition particle subunit SRP68